MDPLTSDPNIWQFVNYYYIFIIDENGLCLSSKGKWEKAWGYYRKLVLNNPLVFKTMAKPVGYYGNVYYWGIDSLTVNIPKSSNYKKIFVKVFSEVCCRDVIRKIPFNLTKQILKFEI
jgi:hypothetical protein